MASWFGKIETITVSLWPKLFLVFVSGCIRFDVKLIERLEQESVVEISYFAVPFLLDVCGTHFVWLLSWAKGTGFLVIG